MHTWLIATMQTTNEDVSCMSHDKSIASYPGLSTFVNDLTRTYDEKNWEGSGMMLYNVHCVMYGDTDFDVKFNFTL